MLDCLILGDSIAVGTQMFKQECVSYSQGGISTPGWLKKFGQNNLSSEVVIISLGTNDSDPYPTLDRLMEVRAKVNAQRVYWIAPNPEKRPSKRQDVYRVAQQFQDVVLTTDRWQADKIHPSWSGYKDIAQAAK